MLLASCTLHKTKIGETIFWIRDVCVYVCRFENIFVYIQQRVSEVNLCMQHNEANAIIYKPVGDMDFARYSFCISLTLSPMHTLYTLSKTTTPWKINFRKKYHLKIAACTSHSLCRTLYSEEGGYKVEQQAN